MTVNLLDVVGDCNLVGSGLGLELGGATVVGWDWDLGGLEFCLGQKNRVILKIFSRTLKSATSPGALMALEKCSQLISRLKEEALA